MQNQQFCIVSEDAKGPPTTQNIAEKRKMPAVGGVRDKVTLIFNSTLG